MQRPTGTLVSAMRQLGPGRASCQLAPRQEPPWLVQLFCKAFVVTLPGSFTGEALTHALGTVCSQDILLMAWLEKARPRKPAGLSLEPCADSDRHQPRVAVEHWNVACLNSDVLGV